jgi:hypothetical protein
MVIVGAVLNLMLTAFFWVDRLKIHLILAGILAAFIGMLVFLIAAMDNPFRGEISISSDALQTIVETLMDVDRPPDGQPAPAP